MPRRCRTDMSGTVVHVLNRAVKRATLFSSPGDYAAFEHVFAEALERHPIRIVAFCVMPNHWHLVAWPGEPGQLSRFMHWLTLAHANRWHAARGTTGTGAVYQGRFKAFPVQSDDHFLRVCRYVERNALRAGLVASAEEWRWGSLWHRLQGDRAGLLSEGPLPLPRDWVDRVNTPETPMELSALRNCARRGAPLGTPEWVLKTAQDWHLLSTLRSRGRPKTEKGSGADHFATAGTDSGAK